MSILNLVTTGLEIVGPITVGVVLVYNKVSTVSDEALKTLKDAVKVLENESEKALNVLDDKSEKALNVLDDKSEKALNVLNDKTEKALKTVNNTVEIFDKAMEQFNKKSGED